MTTVKRSPGLKGRIERYLSQKRQSVAGRLVGVLVDSVLFNTPVEDGHAHTAWIKAAEQANKELESQDVARAVSNHSHEASGDPNAQIAGFGAVVHAPHETNVVLKNKLGFVRTMERGGTLKTIAPHGRKAGGMQTRGVLFAPRLAEGRGLLRWVDQSGNVRFARTRQFTAGRYVRTAVNTTSFVARRNGMKVKQLR